jgi:hypothetical protein
MKKILYLGFIALLFSCTTDKGDGVINVKVSFPEAGTSIISWLDIFPDAEMIALTGENAPMLSQQVSRLFVRSDTYYVTDNRTQKAYRFDKSGKYLNSIGTQGRGPEEYTSLYDTMIDDQGNVVVHPYGEDVLVIYSKDGAFLEKRELSYMSRKFFAHNGFNYHYVGTYTDQEYRLYVTDKNGQTVGGFLPQPTSAPMNNLNFQTFSVYDNAVNFCPPEDNGVYRLWNGDMVKTYQFDFGIYNISDEYFKQSPDTFVSFLSSNSIANKEAFFENDHCAVLFVTIQGPIELDPTFAMGVFDKKKDIWKWFNWDENNFMQFPLYFDEEYTYFLASAELMREQPGLTERFPLLSTVTEGNDTVILKCKTESIKL